MFYVDCYRFPPQKYILIKKMRHLVTHFFNLFSKAPKSDAFDDGDPAEFVRLGTVLDATELVVQLQAPRAGLAVAKLV